MTRSPFLKLVLAGIGAFAIASPVAFAADAAPVVIGQLPIKTKHYLPGSFTVELTDRGEKQLNSQLPNIISNLGYSFNEAYFSDLKWQSTVSYDLDSANIDPMQKIDSHNSRCFKKLVCRISTRLHSTRHRNR